MAATKGHGNPDWTKDEVILALELYQASLPTVPGASDARVKALSQLLQLLPHHATKNRTPTFRNAAGVAFKLQNLHSIATSKGMVNASRIDQDVWSAFGHVPKVVRSLAEQIKNFTDPIGPSQQNRGIDDSEFLEGGVATFTHLSRERNSKLRRKILARHGDKGSLQCAICETRAEHIPIELRESAFEVHHLLPLWEGNRRTKIEDVALLCAICHRSIHQIMRTSKSSVSIEEARKRITRVNAEDRPTP